MIPTKVNGVPSNILNPRNSWTDKKDYDKSVNELANLFIENSKKYHLDNNLIFKDIITISN